MKFSNVITLIFRSISSFITTITDKVPQYRPYNTNSDPHAHPHCKIPVIARKFLLSRRSSTFAGTVEGKVGGTGSRTVKFLIKLTFLWFLVIYLLIKRREGSLRILGPYLKGNNSTVPKGGEDMVLLLSLVNSGPCLSVVVLFRRICSEGFIRPIR